jgi:hypothetical protein
LLKKDRDNLHKRCAALEAENASLKQQLDEANDTIQKLEKSVESSKKKALEVAEPQHEVTEPKTKRSRKEKENKEEESSKKVQLMKPF